MSRRLATSGAAAIVAAAISPVFAWSTGQNYNADLNTTGMWAPWSCTTPTGQGSLVWSVSPTSGPDSSTALGVGFDTSGINPSVTNWSGGWASGGNDMNTGNLMDLPDLDLNYVFVNFDAKASTNATLNLGFAFQSSTAVETVTRDVPLTTSWQTFTYTMADFTGWSATGSQDLANYESWFLRINPDMADGWTFGSNNFYIDNISFSSGCVVLPDVRTWTATSAGDWLTDANWTPGTAPAGDSYKAIFGMALTDDAAVVLPDASIEGQLHLHQLEFDSSHAVTLENAPGGAGHWSTIFMAAYDGNDPVVTVKQGNHSINAQVHAQGNITYDVQAGSLALNEDSLSYNRGSISKTGAGELVMNGGLMGSMDEAGTNWGTRAISVSAGILTANVNLSRGAYYDPVGGSTPAWSANLRNYVSVGVGMGTVNFNAEQKLRSLSVGTGQVNVAAGGDKVIEVKTGLVMSQDENELFLGQIDLADNDMVVRTGLSLAGATAMIKSGLYGELGLWTGKGIASSVAAADANMTTAVGVISNDAAQMGGEGPLFAEFDGLTDLTAEAILVKYTWFGDADLSGVIDGTDYFLIDNGYGLGLNGWLNGDFDYSDTIDGTDYFLIDNAFGLQTGPLSAGPVTVTPEPGTLSLLGIGAVGLLARRRR